MSDSYHPEPYWSDVAKRIRARSGNNIVAGDDEPYYRYKRERFLSMLRSVDVTGKSVLEIGPGPGGNLRELWQRKPARLVGADISAEMAALARSNNDPAVEIVKIDGTSLPFADQEFDVVLTATVLQHNSDDAMMRKILRDACRVSRHSVVIFERVDSSIVGDELCMSRPIEYYADIVRDLGFELKEAEHINIRVSYYLAGFTRKVLNPRTRKEGEPLNGFSLAIQSIFMPLTRILDKFFPSGKDLAKIHFVRKS
jgi:ubiquinone/menaquinone biosynthesis C-methylase UbiE